MLMINTQHAVSHPLQAHSALETRPASRLILRYTRLERRVALKRGTLGRMHYRTLGRTGWKVSEISFGAWAIGSAWGSVDDAESLAALHKATDCGVNFFDTADVYGDGRSERLL